MTAYNTAAIQNAIDKAAAAGGGIVAIPPGRYQLPLLKLPFGVTVVGSNGKNHTS